MLVASGSACSSGSGRRDGGMSDRVVKGEDAEIGFQPVSSSVTV